VLGGNCVDARLNFAEVLLVGDALQLPFFAVVWLQDATLKLGWRTGAIITELEV